MTMLAQLLNEIRTGGTLEANSLAIKLGTTPQLIEAMLEHLQRTGYIKDYVSCGDGCLGCSLSETCGASGQDRLRLWQSKSEF
jgi:hypothetical protein